MAPEKRGAPDARPPRPAAARPEPLVVLQVGDTHLRGAGDRNASDLAAIPAQIGRIAPETFDFVYLPGDLAEDGCTDRYANLADALARHRDLPVLLIPGDHDRQHGTMDAFHRRAAARRGGGLGQWPAAVEHDLPPDARPAADPELWPRAAIPHHNFRKDVRGVRCPFLDVVSPGYGRKDVGLDFRLGPVQARWLRAGLVEAAAAGIPRAVFMHAYPDDLREPDERLDVAGLFWATGVRLVEMGRTHYNGPAHDGRPLYAAARSVGQNEDGPVGYAVAAIDGPVTSWRFRALDRTAPFVLIVSPADRRLAARPATRAGTGMEDDARGRILVRAVVLWEEPLAYVHGRVGTGPRVRMDPAGARCFEARLPRWGEGRSIQVEAVGIRWTGHGPDHADTDVIEPVRAFDEPDAPQPAIPDRPGSDAFRIAAWPEKGVRGGRMGPNRNGREW